MKSFTTDSYGRTIIIHLGKGEKILENTYDKEGHLIKTTDALGRCRETEYTEKGFPCIPNEC